MAEVLSWGLEHNPIIRASGNGKQTIHENWIIEVDTGDSDEGKFAIVSDSRMPARREPHRSQVFMLCENASLTQDKVAPNAWHLATEYTNSLTSNPEFFDNPLKRPAEIQSGSWEKMVRLETDLDGKQVTTTAGEMLFLEIPRNFRQITVTKNLARVPDVFAEEGNFVNKDDFTIVGHKFKKGTMQLRMIEEVGPKWENGVLYYLFTFYLIVNPDGWLFKRRNVGFQEKGLPQEVTLDDGSVKTVRPLESIIIGPPGKRSYPTQPVLLDPNGRAYRGKDQQGLTVVLTPETKSEGGISAEQWKASELQFRGYPEIKFTGNIPTK